jgi:hypothetical protein
MSTTYKSCGTQWKEQGWIISIDTGAEVQTRAIGNLFSETIAKYFPNLGKHMHIQVQEAFRTVNTHNQEKKLSTSY